MQIQKLNVVKIIDEKDFPYYEEKGFRKVEDNPKANVADAGTKTTAAKKAAK